MALPFAGALIQRHGSRAVVVGGSLPFLAAIALIPNANGPIALFLALLLLGAGSGAADVAMNAQGVVVEKRLGRPIMSSLHGLWSVGAMAGAAAGAAVAATALPIELHFLGAAALSLALLLLATRWFVVGDAGAAGGPGFARPTGAILGLAAITFCAMTSEGAMFDWTGLYLRDELAADEATAALAVSLFAGVMAAGRFVGDALAARFPGPTLARGCALLTLLGVATLLAAPAAPAALVGVAVAGAGLSILIPLAFSAAGRQPGVEPGLAIAAVSTSGYGGFLIGPPTIGFVAEQTSLPFGLGLLLLLMAAIVALARATAPAAPT